MSRISMRNICNYANANPWSRSYVDGERILNSNLIVICGVTKIENNEVFVYSLILQTSHITSNRHEVKGKLLINSENLNNEMCQDVIISTMSCTCKGGQSEICKHVVAVLLYCNRYLKPFIFL